MFNNLDNPSLHDGDYNHILSGKSYYGGKVSTKDFFRKFGSGKDVDPLIAKVEERINHPYY